jgi:hypothetical protein
LRPSDSMPITHHVWCGAGSCNPPSTHRTSSSGDQWPRLDSSVVWLSHLQRLEGGCGCISRWPGQQSKTPAAPTNLRPMRRSRTHLSLHCLPVLPGMCEAISDQERLRAHRRWEGRDELHTGRMLLTGRQARPAHLLAPSLATSVAKVSCSACVQRSHLRVAARRAPRRPGERAPSPDSESTSESMS